MNQDLTQQFQSFRLDFNEFKEFVIKNVAMKSDLVEIKENITILKSNVGNLNSDVLSLKLNNFSLSADMAEVKNDVSEIKVDLRDFKSEAMGRFDELASEQASFRQEMVIVNHRLEKLEGYPNFT